MSTSTSPGSSPENASPFRNLIPPPAAVIFDMDGVIVDSEPLHELAFRDIFADLGFPGDAHGIDFTQYYGKSDRALWTDFIARHQPADSLDTLLGRKQSHFLELLRQRQPIFPPIPSLVSDLASRYPLALASGSNHVVIQQVLAFQNLGRHFSAIASVEDVGRPKPHPDVFLRAAALLGLPPAGCLVIEDSAAGVQAAKSAGMRAIAITTSLPAARLSHADFVVGAFDEVRALLLS